MRKSTILREKLAADAIVVLPGAYDALGAKLIEQAGFGQFFTTGFGIAASTLGVPDIGILTQTEIVERARRIASAVNIPLVADMDTGYGNPINVLRTVTECVHAGIAGIILEDQEWPKRCGHLEGKRVIRAEDHVQKLRAAVHARGDDDLVIIARTDARAVTGLDDAIARGIAYRAAGADVVFIEAPRSLDELQRIRASFPSEVPLFANMIEDGVTPFLSARQLQDLGYKMVVYPLSGLFAATAALRGVYTTLHRSGITTGAGPMVGLEEFKGVIGLPAYVALEERFGSAQAAR
ncbi:MAG: oxaloacetate decarboxylase [Actinobacteria bacterium]|nr:oxaloacetate decarboxylase [Actinomycetota bacterium]